MLERFPHWKNAIGRVEGMALFLLDAYAEFWSEAEPGQIGLVVAERIDFLKGPDWHRAPR